MADIQIQPHPDGIRGHQIIDIAVLIQFHLRIAGARAEGAHDHSCATLGAAQ